MGEIIKQEDSNQLALSPKLFNVKEMLLLAKACAGSGFYKDLMRDSNKALVKMMAGHELGFGPSASLTGIYIVKEKISLSANLIAALIKRSSRYDYKVKTLNDDKCELDFYETGSEEEFDKYKTRWNKLGTSTFTMEDAKKAGVTGNSPWKSYPRNMLFARALTNGQKWFCPDVSAGIPIYTPEELGATEDEDGRVIEDAMVSAIHNASEKLPSDSVRLSLIEKLQSLIMRTKVDKEKMLSHYAVSKIEEMTTSILQSAISLLEMRLEVDEIKETANETVSED